MDEAGQTRAAKGRGLLSHAFTEAWLTPIRFALILAVLIAVFFPDALFAGKSFIFRDFGIFTYPNASFQRAAFWRGEFPLWNPLNNCGIPFLAQWNTVCLYPLSLIYLLPPLAWGLTLFFMAHLFLAGLGMYFLASGWTGSRLGGAVAGVAFVFNGMTLNCLMWSSNLAALAWMPWVILAVEGSWSRGGRRTIAAALVSAVQLLAGAPEIIVFTWLVLMLLCVGRLACAGTGRLLGLGRMSLVAGTATLLCAAQLLPFFDLLKHSDRTGSFVASVWAIPLWGWANLFVPLFHCYRAPLGVYFEPWQDWTSSYYLGVGVLALGLFAVARVRSPRVWLLASLGVFGFVVALGDRGGLYAALVNVFPSLGFMRYPIKFAFLTVFSVPLLAAYAVAWLGNPGRPQPSRTWNWIAGTWVLFTVVIAAILWHARVDPFPTENWGLLATGGALRVIFLSVILGAAWISGQINDPRRQACFGLVLIVSIWFDVATHAPRQNPTVAASAFEPGLLTQRLKPAPRIAESRAFTSKQGHDLMYGSELDDVYRDYIARRAVLAGDCNLLDGIPTPDGFYSLYLGEQRAVFNRFFLSPTNAFPSGFADFLGVTFTSDPANPFQWISRSSALPFAMIGPKPLFVELSNTPALLMGADFNPRQNVYLTPDARRFLGDRRGAHGLAQVLHSDSLILDIDAEADAPTLLVLSQSFYHPWRAFVNGRPAVIWRANYAFQAVDIPQGRSRVRLVYRDNLFLGGLIISSVTLCACLILLLNWRTERGSSAANG